MTSLVLSCLDYCNAILANLPALTLMPLQRAQNATARLVVGLDCQSSITTALRDLHWLPVKHRIAFKVATLMHQALHRRCPAYLADLVAFSSTNSSAAQLHYDQSSRDTENSDPVRKTGFLCLRSRRVEQSSFICPHRRLQLVLPPCSQNSSVPACA